MSNIKESIHKKLKLTNFKLSKTNFTKVMKNVALEEYERHCRDFPRVDGDGVIGDDWYYFRFYSGAVNTGCKEAKYAISPSLNVRRNINIGEYYNLSSMDGMTEIED
jgi:hypothetical protein